MGGGRIVERSGGNGYERADKATPRLAPFRPRSRRKLDGDDHHASALSGHHPELARRLKRILDSLACAALRRGGNRHVWPFRSGRALEGTPMKLIAMLRPEQQKTLRRLRKRLANRAHMQRVREARKLLCVGVDLPIEAGTCGRMVHAEAQRCVPCAKRRHWLLTHAMNERRSPSPAFSKTAKRCARTT